MWSIFKRQNERNSNEDGEVEIRRDSPSSMEVTWRARDFRDLRNDSRVTPEFNFAGFDCYIEADQKEEGFIRTCAVFFCRNPPDLEVLCELAVKSKKGALHKMPIDERHVTKSGSILFCKLPYADRVEDRESLVPAGVLTVVCKLSTRKTTVKHIPSITAGPSTSGGPSKTEAFDTSRNGTSTTSKQNSSATKTDEDISKDKISTSVESSETLSEITLSSYGELQTTIKSITDMELTWKVDGFFDLKGKLVTSDEFHFPAGKGFIVLWPHDPSVGLDLLTFFVTFVGDFTAISKQVDFQLALKTAEGKLYTKRLTDGDEQDETTDPQSYSFYRHFKRSEIVDKKELLVPQGNLTVYVTVKRRGDAAERTGAARDQESEASTSVMSESVIDDFERQLARFSVSTHDRNVTVKVGGQEFGTFLSILFVRTPAFASEVRKRMKETSTVEVDDLCGLTTFRAFLEFVNTGDVQYLTTETAFQLYVMADRFKVDELKELCAKYTKRNDVKFMILNC